MLKNLSFFCLAVWLPCACTCSRQAMSVSGDCSSQTVCQAVCNGSQRCNPTSRAEKGLAGSVLQGFFLCHSHTAAPPTSISPTISATAGRMQAGRMQAEQHRSALPWRLRSTAPRCPQVPFRRQALSQDTASRSTSHDWSATGAPDSNASLRQSPWYITKRVSAWAPVYRAWCGRSTEKWPLV